MFYLNHRSRKVLTISVALLGLLLGYQNCTSSSGRVAFSSIKTGVEGFEYFIGGINSRRFVGDTDSFNIMANGNIPMPQNISWRLLLPTGSVVEGAGEFFSYLYLVDGQHSYSVSFEVEGRIINYSFIVQVDPRPGTCTDPNGASLNIAGPQNLNPGTQADFEIQFQANCYTIDEGSIVWDVSNAGGDVFNGNGQTGLNFGYLFNESNTYTVSASVSYQRQGQQGTQSATLTKTVVVGGANGCNSNLITLSQNGNRIGQPVELNLYFPSSCPQGNLISRIDWDIDRQNTDDQPPVDFPAGGFSVTQTFSIDSNLLIPTQTEGIFESQVQVIVDIVDPNTQAVTDRYIKDFNIRLSDGTAEQCQYLASDVSFREDGIEAPDNIRRFALNFSNRISPVDHTAFSTTYRVYEFNSTNGYILVDTINKDGPTAAEEYAHTFTFANGGHKKVEVTLTYNVQAGLPQVGCGTIVKDIELDVTSLQPLQCSNLGDSYKIVTPDGFVIPEPVGFAFPTYVNIVSHQALNSNFVLDNVTQGEYSFYDYNPNSHSYEFEVAFLRAREFNVDPTRIFYSKPAGIYKVNVLTDYVDSARSLTCSDLSKTEYYIIYDANVSCSETGTLYEYNGYCNGNSVVGTVDPIFECRSASNELLDISCCRDNQERVPGTLDCGGTVGACNAGPYYRQRTTCGGTIMVDEDGNPIINYVCQDSNGNTLPNNTCCDQTNAEQRECPPCPIINGQSTCPPTPGGPGGSGDNICTNGPYREELRACVPDPGTECTDAMIPTCIDADGIIAPRECCSGGGGSSGEELDLTPDPINILDFGDSEAGGGESNTVIITGIDSEIQLTIAYEYQGDGLYFKKNGGTSVLMSYDVEQSQGQGDRNSVTINMNANDTLQFRFVGNEDQAYSPRGSASIYLGTGTSGALLDSFSFIGGRP